MKFHTLRALFVEAFAGWREHKASRMAAALAYYTVFSLAPILVISIAVAGLVFGQEAAEGRIVGQISGLVGEKSASAIEAMIAAARKPSSGILATVIGIATLVSAAISAIGSWMSGLLPLPEIALQIVNLAVSVGVVMLLFAMIFRVLPDVEIAWRDVWVGAGFTAVLFALGKLAIGVYLGKSSTASSYGAAGALVVILVWVYYSAQILFFGAELTRAYAYQHGSRIAPDEDAMPIAQAEPQDRPAVVH